MFAVHHIAVDPKTKVEITPKVVEGVYSSLESAIAAIEALQADFSIKGRQNDVSARWWARTADGPLHYFWHQAVEPSAPDRTN